MESVLGGFPGLLELGRRESTINGNDRFFRFVLRKKARKTKKKPPSLAILLADLNC